jgi:hypothetical protein
MSNASIPPIHKNSSTISASPASIPLSSIRQMLPDKAILGAYDFVGRLKSGEAYRRKNTRKTTPNN